MTAKTLNLLAVPGATLHYEVTGSGPMLLLIADGDSDSGAFDSITGELATEYTVVAYDPRGNSRSQYVGNPEGDAVAVSTADALALIDLLSPNAPAFVFGTGTGAITGLDLITHHPDRVRMLVAHEPPCIELLPDATDACSFFEDVHDTYLREGVPMAQLLYAGGTGLDEDDLPAPEDLRPEYRELLNRTAANAETYFAHKLIPFTTYKPDLNALVEQSDKIVPAAGRQAAAHLPARPVSILPTHLGWPVVSFPGPHTGYASHPTPFATLLTQVLEAELT
ncbi:alpha/beta hydrolase [Streptomyces sp. SID13031]|uniref:alpha/beta fold hydrolase n=1 Tax=Streptomyces sp. SID13031 TaxID=2706046 RepID=UPI0013C7E479|nr:alpha/beta hydrolase [Streptomyces sp. SID13031]NEA32261.1 alpha/beta hydrolase [Streptomyces sp. SID13031]